MSLVKIWSLHNCVRARAHINSYLALSYHQYVLCLGFIMFFSFPVLLDYVCPSGLHLKQFLLMLPISSICIYITFVADPKRRMPVVWLAKPILGPSKVLPTNPVCRLDTGPKQLVGKAATQFLWMFRPESPCSVASPCAGTKTLHKIIVKMLIQRTKTLL